MEPTQIGNYYAARNGRDRQSLPRELQSVSHSVKALADPEKHDSCAMTATLSAVFVASLESIIPSRYRGSIAILAITRQTAIDPGL